MVGMKASTLKRISESSAAFGMGILFGFVVLFIQLWDTPDFWTLQFVPLVLLINGIVTIGCYHFAQKKREAGLR